MIRKATNADFDFAYHLYMHPDINPFLLYEQMNKDSFRPVFEELVANGVKYIFNEEGLDKGMFKLIRQKYRNSHIAYLGGVAIHPLFSGKGLGFQMLKEAIVMARDMGVSRIELSTAVFNEKAIRLYQQLGFQQEGLLKRYTHLVSENRFIDEVAMALLIDP